MELWSYGAMELSRALLYLISLDISSMTERSCWYFVCEAGSRAPLVEGMESEAGPVGVEG